MIFSSIIYLSLLCYWYRLLVILSFFFNESEGAHTGAGLRFNEIYFYWFYQFTLLESRCTDYTKMNVANG